MRYRIGVLSDTHGLLRDEVKDRLAGCDRILHAGDCDRPAVLDKLNAIAPTLAVRGNADKNWKDPLPVYRIIEDMGMRIFLIHNRKEIDIDPSGFDLVICGHSHQYAQTAEGKTVWLNPGSCGPRRFRLPVTMAMLTVEEDGRFQIERIDLSRAESPEALIRPGEVKQYLPAIIRDIRRGLSVEQIAGKHHISRELSEQICRLYLTHPGVDADGIMAKMGL